MGSPRRGGVASFCNVPYMLGFFKVHQQLSSGQKNLEGGPPLEKTLRGYFVSECADIKQF